MGRPSRPVNPVIGDRIKQARKNVVCDGKRMTQKLLAGKLYISCQAVKNWEQHINQPDNENLKTIAEICNVNYLWLSGFVDDVSLSSISMLDSLSPKYAEEHDRLANLLWRFGYDLSVFEIDNSNFMTYINRHIAGRTENEIETVIKECMVDYELLKEGFKNYGERNG